jgi:hypothetical protein
MLAATVSNSGEMIMRTIALTTVSGILMASVFASSAFATQEFQKKWLDCEADRHCVVLPGACGSWYTVNRKYMKDARERSEELIKTLECREIEHKPEPSAVCKAATCVITQGAK